MLVKPRPSGILTFGRSDRPSPPPDVAEEVEQYAREYGRHAKVEWVPVMNCWVARFTLKDNDPLKRITQTGEVGEQFEDVYFQEPNPLAGKWIGGQRQGPYRSLDLWQLGPSGVRKFLEKGNTWGRGEVKSHTEAVQAQRDGIKAASEKRRRNAKNNALDMAREVRRVVNKIPFHRVGINLKGE